MDFETLNPPDEMKGDLLALQATVEADKTGERSRRMVQYFKKAETQALELGLRSMDFEEKEFAGMLGEAFSASRRIVMAAWHKTHGSDLVA